MFYNKSMLDQNDLKQIKKLFDGSFQENFERSFGPAFDNAFEQGIIKLIKPSFESFEERLRGVEEWLGSVETKVNNIKKDMVTIDHFDRKMADLKGDTIARERKIDEKVSIANNSLKRNKLLSPQEKKRVAELQVFPWLDGLRGAAWQIFPVCYTK